MPIRTPLRIGLLTLVGSGVALGFSFGLVRVLDLAEIETPRTTLGVLKSWQQQTRFIGREHEIAYLGDSTAIPPDWRSGFERTIPGQIDERLKRVAGMPRVISMATDGFGPVDYYFLASNLAAARPAAIVMSINLAALSPEWLKFSSHPEFASVIGSQRWLEAFGLPLDSSGLTTDRLLLYWSLEELGLSDAWRALTRYQARVTQGWQRLESALDGPSGPLNAYRLKAFARQNVKRQPLEAQRKQQWTRYGSALSGVDPGVPSLLALHATLSYWEEAGIPVLVFTLPVNVDLFDSLGIQDEAAMKQTQSVLAALARSTGAEILDLHDLLPDSSFSDLQGHYSYTEKPDGPKKIAERVAPVLQRMLEARP